VFKSRLPKILQETLSRNGWLPYVSNGRVETFVKRMTTITIVPPSAGGVVSWQFETVDGSRPAKLGSGVINSLCDLLDK
jgi:hypothetical protein